ncbi:hypothetical protein E0H82_12835 [Acinetobacter sp. ANC 4910]|uniref:hypothetical protein n=1 Tax=Acinetobacter sp. ANC 4910 TaxID=2529850 RepID=UPI00103BC676|nr:hypothetical protein [Acinetobacter sp. ANC 4910]TCB33796.1 hypothetical protein E0H82_12835 [Acinetobacter sp. ANC 4910]
MIKHKHLILMVLIGVFLQACDKISDKNNIVEDQKEKSSDFVPPMGPYGLPYSVGRFGGKSVNLGEEVSADYEVCPVWEWSKTELECRPKPKRNYDSIINFMTFKIRYTDGALLVTYIKAPQAAALQKEYLVQNLNSDNPWVTVFAYAGNRYLKDGNMQVLLERYVRSNLQNNENPDKYYLDIYIKTDQIQNGLQKYIPHPKWIFNSGYKNTKDLYIYVDKSQSSRTTIIHCRNHPLTKICEQSFIMEPDMKVFVQASFSRNHLKDWRLIQEKVKKNILSFVVKK